MYTLLQMNKKSNGGVSKGRKISTFFKAPFRIFLQLYISGMSACAGRVDFGAGIGCPSLGYVPTSLPKSFSVGSMRSSVNDEDFAALVRVASTRSLGKKVELELHRQKNGGGAKFVPRSLSAGIGTIKEGMPCEFGEEVVVFPRSRSHAVPRRNGMD